MARFTDDNVRQIRTIVREETADMRLDIAAMKRDISKIHQDLDRVIALAEALYKEVTILAKAVSEVLKFKSQITDNTERLDQLETNGRLTKQTLTIHSKQLKSLGAK